MPPKYLWAWEMYLIVLLLSIIQKMYHLLAPGSPSFLYYFVLRAFDPVFYIVYTAHVLQVLLSVIHWIPVFLCVYRIRFLSAEFWKYFFILRGVFEVTGHSYEVNTFTTFYSVKPGFVLSVLAVFVASQIPSYLACYWYAFQQEKLMPEAVGGKPA